MNDHEVAERLATRAGDLLLDVRAEFAAASAEERKAAGDKRSHEFLMAEAGQVAAGDAVLSEEADRRRTADSARLTSERVWMIDPLDGTREFSELDRDDWAVHVALWRGPVAGHDGQGLRRLVAGAVALPAQNTTLHTPQVAAPRAVDGPPRTRRCRAPDHRRSPWQCVMLLTAYWSKWVRREPKSLL